MHWCAQHDHLNVKETEGEYVCAYLTLLFSEGHTCDIECEAPISLLSSCHLTGVCPSITGGSCVDNQDVFIVDLSTMFPNEDTVSIWITPFVAEWCSIR